MKKTYVMISAALLATACSNQELPTKRESSGKITVARDAVKQTPVKIIKTNKRVSLDKKSIECLARNVFHEAGVESRAGKIAVAQVTLNRVKTQKWGKSVCEAVYSKAQFSWTLEKKKRASKPEGQLWKESVQAVHDFASGDRVTHVDNSLFYHTNYIKQPNWADSTKITARVGQHIFYADARKS